MITLRIRFSSSTVRPKDWTLSCSYSHLSIFNFNFIMNIIYQSLWFIQHHSNNLNDIAFNISLEGPSFEVSVQQKQLDVRYNCEVVSMRMALIDSYICLPCLCYPVRGTVWKGLAGGLPGFKNTNQVQSLSLSLCLSGPPISLCTSLSLSACNLKMRG